MFPVADMRLSIGRLARRMRQTAQDRLTTESQLGALFALDAGGPQTVGELAEQQRITSASMTSTVNGLESAGLVTRRTGEDRRRRVVEISGAGKAHVDAVLKDRDEWLMTQLEQLSDEDRTLLQAAVPVLVALAHS